ncbi:MAG: winged helix-turn-helix transcriptional regulator [Calditrichaeota bacterium]|nr:winged helix-turn-helix transcriptional regulator [Calditrichota bacterium]
MKGKERPVPKVDKDKAEKMAELAPRIMGAFHDLGPQHPEGETLTMRQYQALIIVYAADKLTIREFCEKLDLAPSTGTELANRMVASGFLEKSGGEQDKRQAVLRVSEKGCRLLEERRRALTQMFERFLERFSPEDQEAFVQSFEQIWAIIRKYRKGGPSEQEEPSGAHCQEAQA